MRLELTKKTDLAFQALVLIAAQDGKRVNGAALASELEVSGQYLPHVMAPLTRSGWVASVSGPHGGYELFSNLEDVSLLDLIEAVEGTVDDSRCLHLGPVHNSGVRCALHEPWMRAKHAMISELSSTKLSDLAPIG